MASASAADADNQITAATVAVDAVEDTVDGSNDFIEIGTNGSGETPNGVVLGSSNVNSIPATNEQALTASAENSDGGDVLKANNNNQILGKDASTFPDLNIQIKNNKPGETLFLENDFKDTIDLSIDKSITIDGQGHTLDFSQTGKLTLTANNIYLKNIILKDAIGYSFPGSDCSISDSTVLLTFEQIGSVYFGVTGSNFEIANCRFTGGGSFLYSTSEGIFFRTASANTKISNVVFDNLSIGKNTDLFYLYLSTSFEVYNVTITNVTQNSETTNRALVKIYQSSGTLDRLNVTPFGTADPVLIIGGSSTYIQNSIFDCGGAKFIGFDSNPNLNLKNCTINNVSSFSSTAESAFGALFFEDCIFTNWTSSIVANKPSIIKNTTFKGFTKTPLVIKAADVKLYNSQFENNTPEYLVSITVGKFTAENVTFIENNNAEYDFYTSADDMKVNLVNITNDTTLVNRPISNYATYVVVYVSPDGVDPDGLSPETPCNLTTALRNIESNGFIYLFAGNYSEITTRQTISCSIIGQEPDVLINNASFTLSIPNLKLENITFNNTQATIRFVDSSAIKNCNFTNIPSITLFGLGISDSGGNTALGFDVENCKISNSSIVDVFRYHRYYPAKITNFTIEDSSFTNFMRYYGPFTIDVDGITIRNSTFINVFNSTISMAGSVNNVNIFNSTFDSYLFHSAGTYGVNNITIGEHSIFNGDYLCYANILTLNGLNIDDLTFTKSDADVVVMNAGSGNILCNATLSNTAFRNLIRTGGTDTVFTLDGLTLSNVVADGIYSSYAHDAVHTGLNFTDCIFNNEILTLGINSNIEKSNFTNVTGRFIIDGNSVNIKDSIFKNYYDEDANGSCIYLKAGDYFIISSCAFINNTGYNGGAVYICNVTSSSQIKDCIFVNNTAINLGGGIYYQDTLDDVNISYFVDSFTRENQDNNTCLNTTDGTHYYFIYNNTAEPLLEAVYVVVDPEAYNPGGAHSGALGDPTTFDKGMTKVAPSGTVYFALSGETFELSQIMVVNIDNVTYMGNDTTLNLNSYYFVINPISVNVSFYNIVFNSSVGNSAIVWNAPSGLVDGCNFTNNGGANLLSGGAIQALGDDFTVKDSVFVNNSATKSGTESYGGAIYINATNVNILDSVFEDNSAGYMGSHIHVSEDSMDTNICGCEFYNSTTDIGLGSALSIEGTNANVTDCVFVNNSGRQYGGAIYNGGFNEGILRITGCNFTGNYIISSIFDNRGGAVGLADADSTVFIEDCIFKDNAAEYGGAVYNDCKLTLSGHNSFVNNSASSDGGAIYNNAVSSVSGASFVNNTATNGGAVYTVAALDISDSSFVGNNATNQGGAVYFASKGNNLNGVLFENNTANEGSAIYLPDGKDLTLRKVTLTNNTDTNNECTIHVGEYATLSIPDDDLVKSDDKEKIHVTEYFSDVLYVSTNGTGKGLTSDDPATLNDELFTHLNDGGKIVFAHDTYTIAQSINKNVTLVGNGSTFKRDQDKYLYILGLYK